MEDEMKRLKEKSKNKLKELNKKLDQERKMVQKLK